MRNQDETDEILYTTKFGFKFKTFSPQASDIRFLWAHNATKSTTAETSH